ncbi:glycosyltransferase family 4 protein [uncultured Erythrobacter sp.]|uniref:glycosyltransferase family 4 protein n=1 Tax=uncultured Erythrobacter sp. TaxID=263913 RepID=UPI00260C2C5B|nr:glycosyltransferase family 4 protein [uncultured Erythrobacter sp.]
MTAMPTDLPTRSADRDTNVRVLFITRKWGPAVGGMETYCERLTEELAKHRPVDVIALEGRANGQPPSAASLLFFPFTVLRRLIGQSEKPGIVHIGDMAIWPLALMAWLFFPAAKMVISAHGTDVSYGARGGIRGSLYNLYLALGARLLAKARVIANSRATRNRLKQINWNCSAVVPLATDLRGEPSADYDARQLVFAGRLIRQKGLSWFVAEVLPLLPADIRLTVIGTRWDSSEESALEHPGVEFLGPLPQAELARHFAQAACVVIPNVERSNGEFEGFGLIAPEAASAGGVVLAAATGGLKDAVIDGETGFQIAPGDPQSWVSKITEVLDWSAKKRSTFLARSQTKAQSHYTWSRVAAETAEAYSS